jgi:hypothetical protein
MCWLPETHSGSTSTSLDIASMVLDAPTANTNYVHEGSYAIEQRPTAQKAVTPIVALPEPTSLTEGHHAFDDPDGYMPTRPYDVKFPPLRHLPSNPCPTEQDSTRVLGTYNVSSPYATCIVQGLKTQHNGDNFMSPPEPTHSNKAHHDLPMDHMYAPTASHMSAHILGSQPGNVYQASAVLSSKCIYCNAQSKGQTYAAALLT